MGKQVVVGAVVAQRRLFSFLLSRLQLERAAVQSRAPRPIAATIDAVMTLTRSMRLRSAAAAYTLAVGALTIMSLSTARAVDPLTGLARVIDGDTIAIGSQHIRLAGIDAPETDQVCLDSSVHRWACGVAARDQLSRHIADRTVSCKPHGEDRYGRILAVCSTDNQDLNRWMVREGLALAYTKYSRDYIADEAAARELRKGMWAGAFIAPWDWRHRDARTVILGGVSVPTGAQAELSTPASSASAPTSECIIKGNVNIHGERIYHMPGQSAYSKINMQDPRKRWFCSEEDARTAGWRPAKH